MKNLYAKIHKATYQMESLEKDMTVGSGNYEYKGLSESKVLNTVKGVFEDVGLIVVPIDTEVQEHEILYKSYNKDKNRFMTQIKVKWLIADIESGESMELSSVGNGADTGDKGSGKAMTYAYKSMLQKTFMMFSGEDTDNTHSKDLPGNKSENKSTETKVSTKQLENIIKKAGVTKAQIIKTYLDETGKTVDDIKFISQEKKQDYYKRAENRIAKSKEA
jgi:hypothetical protein